MFKFFVYVFICICICIPPPPPPLNVSLILRSQVWQVRLVVTLTCCPRHQSWPHMLETSKSTFWCISVLICFSLRFARPNKKCLHSDRVRSGLCLNTTNNLGLIWISIGGVEVGTILSMEGLHFLCYQIIYAADDVRCLFETLDKNKNLSVQ